MSIWRPDRRHSVRRENAVGVCQLRRGNAVEAINFRAGSRWVWKEGTRQSERRLQANRQQRYERASLLEDLPFAYRMLSKEIEVS